jgi:hypothetical protein
VPRIRERHDEAFPELALQSLLPRILDREQYAVGIGGASSRTKFPSAGYPPTERPRFAPLGAMTPRDELLGPLAGTPPCSTAHSLFDTPHGLYVRVLLRPAAFQKFRPLPDRFVAARCARSQCWATQRRPSLLPTIAFALRIAVEETHMSKGMDTKKDTKKKATKTLMEKRAAKKQKKASRPFQL